MVTPAVSKVSSDWRWRLLHWMRVVAVRMLAATTLAMTVATIWSVGFVIVNRTPRNMWTWSIQLVIFAGIVALFAALIWSMAVVAASRIPGIRGGGPIRAIIGGAIAGACGGLVSYWLFFGWRDPIEWTLSLVKITTPCGAVFGLMMERVSAFRLASRLKAAARRNNPLKRD